MARKAKPDGLSLDTWASILDRLRGWRLDPPAGASAMEMEIGALRAELAEARVVLERIYPYIESLNHFHLPNGDILYASAVWDVLHHKVQS